MPKPTTFFILILPVSMLMLMVIGMVFWIVGAGRTLTSPPTMRSSTASGTTPALVEYEEGHGTLTGKIVQEDGSPNTVPVQLNYFSRRETETSSHSAYGSANRVTDEFEVEAPSGEVYLIAYPEEKYAPSWIGPVENHADGVIKDLTITLNPGSPLDLHLVDEAGEPVQGVSIVGFPIIHSESGSHLKPEKIAEGHFRYPHAAEATYKLSLEAPGFEPTTVKVEKAASLGKQTIEMVRASPTTGIVLDTAGEPIADAKFLLYLTVNKDYLDYRSTHSYRGKEIGTTDQNGRFSLSELSSDKYYYGVVEAPDQSRTVFQNYEAGQNDLDVTIPPLRSLYVKANGDLSQLKTRYFREIKAMKPYVRIRQSFQFDVDRDNSHWANMDNDLQLEPSEKEVSFTYDGLFANQVNLNIGPYVVQFHPDDINPDGDIELEFNLDTGEKTLTAR